MSEPTLQGATDLGGGVDRISALLNPEQTPTEGESVEAEAQASAPETPEGDTEATEPTYTVKVGDEDREVTIDEMRKGYMMESDYRKKTSEVAERRKALEAKEAEFDAQLNEAHVFLEMEVESLSSDEMQQLKHDDPDAYLKEFDRVQAKVDAFNKAKDKRDAELKEKSQERAHIEREALLRAIPEWLDSNVMAEEGNAVLSHVKALGFSDEEVGQMIDHRLLVMARNSMRLEQINSQDISDKKVETPPKTQQPAAKADPVSQQTERIKGMRSQLKRSGSMQDAARLFKGLMEE